MSKPRKGLGIDFDADDDDTAQSKPLERMPRTGIGAISASLAMGRAVEEENRGLKDKVAELQQREFMVKIDPQRVRPSQWANRHHASFKSDEYSRLRDEIASAGGNVQPIKVRPVLGDPAHDFEIVYGHRRHAACLELGLSANCIVAELSDQQLFEEMERENRDRADLSPWEQGMHYQRALDRSLYSSVRQLATAVGAPQSNVTTALQLANLPDFVVSAFPSPLTLQHRWAVLLNEGVRKDATLMAERAKRIEQSAIPMSPKEVLTALLADGVVVGSTETMKLRANGKVAGTFSRDTSGALTIKVKAGVLDKTREEKLSSFIEQLMKG